MIKQEEKNRLSQYLDGELEPSQMDIEEENIQNNKHAQTYILQNAIGTARFKQAMKSDLKKSESNISDNYTDPILKFDKSNKSNHLWYQIAACFIIFFLGSGIGLLYTEKIVKPESPFIITSIPMEYRPVINHALEFEKSGISYNSKAQEHRLIVTPIRTFKNKNGKYFREYQLQIELNGHLQKVKCVAFRSGPKEWSTIALFFSANDFSIIS